MKCAGPPLPGLWGKQVQLCVANGTVNRLRLSEEHSGNVPLDLYPVADLLAASSTWKIHPMEISQEEINLSLRGSSGMREGEVCKRLFQQSVEIRTQAHADHTHPPLLGSLSTQGLRRSEKADEHRLERWGKRWGWLKYGVNLITQQREQGWRKRDAWNQISTPSPIWSHAR